LPKKLTTFCGDVCHVRFNRKTFPKSGKSIINNCFVEGKDIKLIWDTSTRALLGLTNEANLEATTAKYQKQFKELLCRN
jgi:hypothetical protein